MASDRKKRLEPAILEELAGLIPDLKDPRVRALPLLSVTKVELNGDLSVGKIWVTATGASDEQLASALEGLKSAGGMLRGEIGRRFALRHAPELRFYQDRSGDMTARLEAIVREDEEKKKE